MKLVIVESPAKSKTISRYLGEDYIVEASVGHICDLATSGKGGLGVDIDNNFKPTYVINKDKKKVVNLLKKKQKEAEEVILATDPDREGEAIAYHLATTLKLPIETTKRLEFHEITRSSITEAIENPRTINMKLVNSQETRRIVDRILGFKLSKLLKSKINSQSAGRVQSVTLKLICDHEEEIKNFVPEEYWKMNLTINSNSGPLTLNFSKIDGKSYDKLTLEQANDIISRLENKKLKITDINKSKVTVSSSEPFRTSTLQQEASSKFGYRTKEIASIAQKLYEGVETKEGLVGLITYIRTDSTKLSDSFVAKSKEYILSKYGEEYYKGPKEQKNVKNSQDAHEAIRPTDLSRDPKSLKPYLSDKEYKIYKLIYNRTLASLMSPKINEVTRVTFEQSGVEFILSGSVTIFKGFDILGITGAKQVLLEDFKLNEEYEIVELLKEQNFTKAPSRYTEGRLIKLLEDKGIGRPSTYSSTIQTLVQRKYITLTGGSINPTEQGTKTSFVLTKYFPNLMSTDYTARMECDLDLIQTGEKEELAVLNEFYTDFEKTFEEVKNRMYKDEPEFTGETCPVCGGPLVIRHGKNGDFVSCNNFPTCTYIKKEEPVYIGRNCPQCGEPLIERVSRYGNKFIGCSNFPKCRYIESKNETIEDRTCPECGGKLIKKFYRGRSFIGCENYPNCTYSEKVSKNEKSS